MMATEWTDEVGLPQTRRLSALVSLLVIGGLSLALWSAIVAAAVHIH
jgi:hypothetical protein